MGVKLSHDQAAFYLGPLGPRASRDVVYINWKFQPRSTNSMQAPASIYKPKFSFITMGPADADESENIAFYGKTRGEQASNERSTSEEHAVASDSPTSVKTINIIRT